MAAASLGLNAAKHDDDQMMLRALLGTADHLTVERVVQMVASIPGVIACANARGVKVFSHGEASSAGQDFRNQAVEIARSMRTLASVIGIDGETLSIATGERLITFCFQGENAFGVLHADKTAPAGLREKITLLSREVARMSM